MTPVKGQRLVIKRERPALPAMKGWYRDIARFYTVRAAATPCMQHGTSLPSAGHAAEELERDWNEHHQIKAGQRLVMYVDLEPATG